MKDQNSEDVAFLNKTYGLDNDADLRETLHKVLAMMTMKMIEIQNRLDALEYPPNSNE